MILSFGAELHLLEELLRIQAAVTRAMELAREDTRIFLPSQFSNADNPACHEATTGPEIIQQTGGSLDAFVMGVGTGGTLMGVGRAIRQAGIRAELVAGRDRVAELEILEQRQIGAMQFAVAQKAAEAQPPTSRLHQTAASPMSPIATSPNARKVNRWPTRWPPSL